MSSIDFFDLDDLDDIDTDNNNIIHSNIHSNIHNHSNNVINNNNSEGNNYNTNAVVAAIGICAGIFQSLGDQVDHNNSIVTAEYPLANAIFVDKNQTLINHDDFLILSNTEENINWSFDDMVFAEPITDDICIATTESNVLPFEGAIRDALNSIEESDNWYRNNNDDDTTVSTKLQILHDLGYDLSQCEKDDLFDKKNIDEKECFENKEFTKSKVEKLIKITKNANNNNISLLVKNNLLPSCADKIEIEKYRKEAIRRYQAKKLKRNWQKLLPDMKNRSEAAKKRQREIGKGKFLRKVSTTSTTNNT